MGTMTVVGVFMVIIAVLGLASIGIAGFFIDNNYEHDIGGYFANAELMNTPDGMLHQLELGRQGMVDAGLTNEMYGAMFFKRPDNSMLFQYQHIDSIIERVKAVEEWYNDTYMKNGTIQTETMGDVYQQKMANLATFIAEGGRSDWIAKDVWMIKNHPIMYFKSIPLGLLLLFGVIGWFMASVGD